MPLCGRSGVRACTRIHNKSGRQSIADDDGGTRWRSPSIDQNRSTEKTHTVALPFYRASFCFFHTSLFSLPILFFFLLRSLDQSGTPAGTSTSRTVSDTRTRSVQLLWHSTTQQRTQQRTRMIRVLHMPSRQIGNRFRHSAATMCNCGSVKFCDNHANAHGPSTLSRAMITCDNGSWLLCEWVSECGACVHAANMTYG